MRKTFNIVRNVFAALFALMLVGGAIGGIFAGGPANAPAVADATQNSVIPAEVTKPDPSPARPGYTARFLVAPNRTHIFVWKDEDSLVRGVKIVFSGGPTESLDLLTPLVSCVVKSGAKIIVDEDGPDTSSVLVVGGDKNGCEGRVMNIYITRSPT
jgi:hypothetical protein